jgi:hypothetical protein
MLASVLTTCLYATASVIATDPCTASGFDDVRGMRFPRCNEFLKKEAGRHVQTTNHNHNHNHMSFPAIPQKNVSAREQLRGVLYGSRHGLSARAKGKFKMKLN